MLATELSGLLKVTTPVLDYNSVIGGLQRHITGENIDKLNECINTLDQSQPTWPTSWPKGKELVLHKPDNINALIKVLQSNSEVINTPGPSMFRKAANLLGITGPKPEPEFDPRKGFWNQESLQRHTASSVSDGGTQGFR